MLSGKIAIVTAAAGGIGQSVVEMFVRNDATVVAVDIRAQDLSDIASPDGGTHGSCVSKSADVLDEDSVAGLVAEVVAEFGRIDVLVNCVGGSTTSSAPDPKALTEDMSLDYWRSILDLNLTSTFLCCKAVLPQMKSQGYGRIVNVASYNAYGAIRESGTAYAAAKAAVIGFTKRLALESAPHGVAVNATAPAPTLTERVAKNFIAKMSEDQQRQYAAHIPLGRLAEPAEQASAIMFLASDLASFVNGAVLDVTGGAIASPSSFR